MFQRNLPEMIEKIMANDKIGANGIKEDPLNRCNPSGIEVLIVGGGVGGLFLALECFRNGHKVEILEARATTNPAGDIFTIGKSATGVLKYWPMFADRLEHVSSYPDFFYLKYTGEKICGPVQGLQGTGRFILRNQMHECLLAEIKRLGIPIKFGSKVTGYFETNDKGGVHLIDGQIITADVVVAADGTHSKSWRLITGEQAEAKSSGSSVYRTAFPTELAMADPVVRANFDLGPDSRPAWYFLPGPDVHANVLISPSTVCWFYHHRDEADTSNENWSSYVSIDRALEVFDRIPGWYPAFLALVKTTPANTINDWRLMWRNPQPKWASPKGRVVQVGDSAHTFLPTSANGATQAIEDAISLATCLQIGGKDRVSLATKVHNKLRFERVSTAQRMGMRHRENFHKTDWKAIEEDPSKIAIGPGKWNWQHDPERYAMENFDACAEYLLHGAPFKNTNLPPGYEYKPWTIEELLKDAEEGKRMNDEGDWS